jgi:C-terminal processing protease CtpA/Prc
VLSGFTLTFDYQARTVTFEPNGRVGQPFLRDRTGMTVHQRHPGAFDVISVAIASPSSEARIKVGDEVVAVDGRNVATMGIKDFDSYREGTTPFSLTLHRNGQREIVRIEPRTLL